MRIAVIEAPDALADLMMSSTYFWMLGLLPLALQTDVVRSLNGLYPVRNAFRDVPEVPPQYCLMMSCPFLFCQKPIVRAPVLRAPHTLTVTLAGSTGPTELSSVAKVAVLV